MGPIVAAHVAVRGTFSLIEDRAQNDVDGKAIGCVNAPNRAGGKPRQGPAASDDLHVGAMREHLRVTRDHDPDVAQPIERTRKRGRDCRQSSNSNEVIEFRSDE